ncbi:MAG: hypothetical protein NTZ90_18775 [Proteobacteria bacterium]|nr:hypothetical protein [Pseudomonadota bacterium]
MRPEALRHWLRCLLVLSLAGLVSACNFTVWQLANDVKLLGLKPEPGKGARIARLNDEVCDLTLTSIGAKHSRFEEAMTAAISDHKVAYFRNVTTDDRQETGLLAKSCLVFMGDAY